MRKKDDLAIDKIMECAKTEFLEKGFEGASMRKVAENAGYTTGMLYGRFADKGELFKAIVKASAEKLYSYYAEVQENFAGLSPETQYKDMHVYVDKRIDEMLDIVYGDFDGFKLSSVKARAANTKSISIVLSKSKPKIPFVL